MARLLAATGWAITRIRTSPLVRTCESGAILSEGLREFRANSELPLAPEVITEKRLAPGFDLDTALQILDEHQSNDVAVWIFHAPDVQRLAAELVGLRESAFYFTPGSMLALNLPLPQPAGKALLVWEAQPEYLRQLL
jgi:phosphohistidine phosphatase SixA